MQIEQLKPIIEAALLAATQPMTIAQLGDLFVEDDEVGRDDIARTLEALSADCEGRGVQLLEVASGFRYQVRQEVHPWISRMWTEKPSRYSRALLETLALIAYRQPITRPEIEQIRGVVVSSNIVKTLEEREWIRVVGYRDVPGKPALFGTTRAFLDYFNLKSLDELPPLSEIREMEDPQMRIDQEPLPPRVIKDLPIDPESEAQALAEAAARLADDGLAEAAAEGELAENQAQAEAELEEAANEHTTPAPATEATDTDQAQAGEPEPEATQDSRDDGFHVAPATDEHAQDTAPVAVEEPEPAQGIAHGDDTPAHPANADDGDAEQDTEEYRA